MKNSSRLGYPAIAVLFLFVAGSCQKTASSGNSNATPLQNYIGSDTSLTLYNAVVTKANDASLFSGTDSVTVLAPTNTAFLAAGITIPTIAGWSAGFADSLIRYHYIAGAADLVSGSYTSFNSLLSPAVYGYTDGTYYYFNGTLAAKDMLSGGAPALYELNSILPTPAASLSKLLSADTSLSFFMEALTRTGLAANLGAGGWNTVFATVNSAFISYGYTNVDTLDLNMLTAMMQYHIVGGQYFTNILAGQVSVVSTDGDYININPGSSGLQLTGTGNGAAVNIIAGNRLAGNTIVLHKIDNLLLQ